MPISEDSIREALKQVIDPELFVNIIDLGLVYGVVVEPAGDKENVKIDMTMTSPACPAGPHILQQVDNMLKEMEGVEDVDIKVVWTPPWSPDMLSEDAKDQLGIF